MLPKFVSVSSYSLWDIVVHTDKQTDYFYRECLLLPVTYIPSWHKVRILFYLRVAGIKRVQWAHDTMCWRLSSGITSQSPWNRWELSVLVNYKFSYSYSRYWYNERYRYMDGDTFVTLKALMLRINYARQSNRTETWQWKSKRELWTDAPKRGETIGKIYMYIEWKRGGNNSIYSWYYFDSIRWPKKRL